LVLLLRCLRTSESSLSSDAAVQLKSVRRHIIKRQLVAKPIECVQLNDIMANVDVNRDRLLSRFELLVRMRKDRKYVDFLRLPPCIKARRLEPRLVVSRVRRCALRLCCCSAWCHRSKHTHVHSREGALGGLLSQSTNRPHHCDLDLGRTQALHHLYTCARSGCSKYQIARQEAKAQERDGSYAKFIEKFLEIDKSRDGLISEAELEAFFRGAEVAQRQATIARKASAATQGDRHA
jgi:hypothetical protein